MNSKTSTILATPPGMATPVRIRIVPKPSRYFKTRYWVVLPPTARRKERWRLVPNRKSAEALISRWLAVVAKESWETHEQSTR